MKFEWETINDNDTSSTHRSPVIGGWIVRYNYENIPRQNDTVAMVFIPDPNHEWQIDEYEI